MSERSEKEAWLVANRRRCELIENSISGVLNAGEFAELEKEKQVLVSEKGKYKTRSQIKARNERVTRYNNRLADYEKRRKAFQKEGDAYNEKLKKLSESQKDKDNR